MNANLAQGRLTRDNASNPIMCYATLKLALVLTLCCLLGAPGVILGVNPQRDTSVSLAVGYS